MPGNPCSVDELRRFSGLPPHQLLLAQQEDSAGSTYTRVRIQHNADGYEAGVLQRRNGRETSKPLQLERNLDDYLAVERWLQAGAQPGTERAFDALDFSTLALRRDTWTLLERLPDGYVVRKSSPLDATRLRLDRRFRPVQFDMAGTFEIAAVDKVDLPIAPEPVFHSASNRVPLNAAIERHGATRGLTLKVSGDRDLIRRWVSRWEGARYDGSELFLKTRRARVRDATGVDPEHYRREELSYPISDRQVRSLARQAAESAADPMQQAEQLTRFVHDYIEYDHHSTMQNVLEVVRNQRGDCNEYAELYTTLGRALGLPVRTVIGLAYSDRERPAFALHAWNEVLFADGWRGFDPTWNTVELDATHIPLPEDQAGLLTGLTALDRLRFELVAVRYL